jgi:hypothetical protein
VNNPDKVANRTLSEIAEKWKDGFDRLRRSGGFCDEDWFMGTEFEVLSEDENAAIYIAENGTVVEISRKVELEITPYDAAYAEMLRDKP